MTDRLIKREAWRKAAVKALAVGLDRDKLEGALMVACAITGKTYEEREHTTTIHGGPKFIWTDDGQIKSIIKNGKAYGPDGERRYVAPRGKK